jgi:periplasmic protein thiol:disulfide oxidoreductases, DsbE subfamily
LLIIKKDKYIKIFKMKKFIFFTPLIIIFLILSMLLFALLSQNIGNKKTINSVLLNKPIPTKNLLSLNLNEPIDLEMYSGSPFLVNFFSSWCEPCKLEASNLEKLSERIPIIGISYKDQKEDTYLFLDKYGNPYDEISYDSDGNIAINWGVYGVPETFIINKNGIIILRHPGPITTNVLKNEIMPILDEINL